MIPTGLATECPLCIKVHSCRSMYKEIVSPRCGDWCEFCLCWKITSNFKNRKFTLLWMKWHILLYPFHEPCCCLLAYKLKYLCALVTNPTVKTPISFLISCVLSFLEVKNRSQRRVPDQKHKEWQASFPCDYFISLFWRVIHECQLFDIC